MLFDDEVEVKLTIFGTFQFKTKKIGNTLTFFQFRDEISSGKGIMGSSLF